MTDFRSQATQMLELIESKLESHQRTVTIEFIALKLRAVFEEGVAKGRRYEREGEYPYSSLATTTSKDAF